MRDAHGDRVGQRAFVARQAIDPAPCFCIEVHLLYKSNVFVTLDSQRSSKMSNEINVASLIVQKVAAPEGWGSEVTAGRLQISTAPYYNSVTMSYYLHISKNIAFCCLAVSVYHYCLLNSSCG